MEENVILSKKEQRKQRKLDKQQKRDFERYGIKPGDLKNKKTSTNWKALGKCFKYYNQNKGLVFGLIVVSLLRVCFAMLIAVGTERLINFVSLGDFKTAVLCLCVIVGSQVLSQIIFYFWNLFSVKLSNNITLKIRSELIQNIFKTKAKKYDTINSGELISRINSDSKIISDLVDTIAIYASDMLKSVGYIIFFFVLNIWLGLAMCFVVITFVFLDTINQRYVQSANKKEKFLSDKNIGIVSEIVRAIRDIKCLNIKKNIETKYQQNIKGLMNVSNDRIKYGEFLFRLMWTILVIAEAGVILLAIYFASQNIVTLSVIVIFIMYEGNALWLVNAINQIRRKLKTASLSAERICEVFDDNDYPKETFGTKTIKKPKGEIVFENVDFAYNEKSKVLENFNLTIKAGQTVAFVGKSGNGKSTLINLIPKLYEISGGKVKIDGVDISKLSEESLRSLVTIVPQSPYIFNASIRENLALVKPDMTEEEMINACKMAQIHDFIMEKELGYDSIVGENGVILSGGQKQRIAIARALLKNSKIILLDEATSALDNESQAKVKEALDNLGGEHTIVIVAHRLSTVVDADKIVVVEQGKIVGEGTHKELLKSCKQYKNLYKTEGTN